MNSDQDMTIAGAPRLEILGSALAIGAKLISEGRLSEGVVREDPGMYALCLAMEQGFDVRELSPGSALTVGRAESPSPGIWSVKDKWLSKAHFRVTVAEGGDAMLEDLDSLNGTFVNDCRVTDCRALLRGDVLRAGHSVWVLL